ncbi:MAG: hypothetical protein ACREBE_04795 [bacterium]
MTERVIRRTCLAALACATSAAALGAQIAPTSLDSVYSRGLTADTSSHRVRARFAVAPYAWMSGLTAQTGVGNLAADVNLNFGDIFSHLRFAAMGAFEVGYGAWLGTLDAMYSSMQVDRTVRLISRHADLDFSSKMFMAQPMFGYTFGPSPNVAIDAMVGARLWSVDASLSVVDTSGRTQSRSPTWIDAVGGLRFRWRPKRPWNVSALGDAGGGGSELTAQGLVTVSYDFSRHWAAFGSYRYLYDKYRPSDYFFEGHVSGPLLGGVYRW